MAGGIKRDKTDAVFSYLVRERADFTCENCGRNYRHEPGYIDCSHLFSRGNLSVRLQPSNAFCHCRDCHTRFGKSPARFKQWARGKLGDQIVELLEKLFRVPSSMTAHEKELVHGHFMKERIRLREARAAGAQGRLNFTTNYPNFGGGDNGTSS